MPLSVRLAAFAAFLLVSSCNQQAVDPNAPPFAKTLAEAGATPKEVARMIEEWRGAPPELKMLFENNDPARLKGYLEYKRTVWAGEDAHPVLKPGAAMPDFALKGVDGKTYTSASVKGAKAVVVSFISNHCPASQLYEGRLKKLVADYRSKGVAFLAIQPDGKNASAPSEMGFTDVEDDMAGMQERARHRAFPFPYLDDGVDQAAAKAFGPKATPHQFIFDASGKLRFEGRIDDNLNEAKATTHETRDALDAVLAGREVAVAHTPVFGCSIKWNDRQQAADRERAEWKTLPVSLASISNAKLTEMRITPPKKVTIFNFWATWCGPCKVEMPEIVKTWQWYRGRNVDLVTVTVDDPANRARAEAFLKQVHIPDPARNYIVDSTDLFAIQKAFDATWQSGVPMTLVLGTDGKVIYRENGEVDILKMRRAILASLNEPGPFAGNDAYWRN